jgi:hypothetical protein
MPELWDRVDQLVDRAPSLEALRAHGLHLLATRLWRSRGLPVPADLLNEQRRAEMVSMAAPALLRRACAAYGGELMLMKGPEVAARYRHPSDRGFHDLDLLADDAPAAQRALIAAGFAQFGNPTTYDDAQHLCPLIWPGMPLIIEVHRHPNRPPWLPFLSACDVLEHSVPSVTGVPGLVAPAPSAHALLLAAHSWSHQPLGRLTDLLDVAVVLAGGGRRRAGELARRWGWDGIWRVVLAAADAILGDNAPPLSLSVWARHLRSARERTVLEDHFARLAAPASAVPVTRAPGALAGAVRCTATPREAEPWADKLRRSRLAFAHAFTHKSDHERQLSPYHRSNR